LAVAGDTAGRHFPDPSHTVLGYAPNAVRCGGALFVGMIGAGALLADDRIPDKPPFATESKAPRGNPMPDAA
jgi:hypothetical protein